MEEELKKLEIYQIAHYRAVEIHRMSLRLPALERYEEAPQIRRSSKAVAANIVEGHTQRKYKAQYLLYLYRAAASSDETQEHLLLLHETGSLTDAKTFHTLLSGYELLSQKIFNLIQRVEASHETPNYLKRQEGAPSKVPSTRR